MQAGSIYSVYRMLTASTCEHAHDAYDLTLRIAERPPSAAYASLSVLSRTPQATFEDCFAKQYAIIHRLETNKLRNVAKLFAHLLANDAISWGVMQCIRLTEDDTTSSSRIFIKYIFQVRGLWHICRGWGGCRPWVWWCQRSCMRRTNTCCQHIHDKSTSSISLSVKCFQVTGLPSQLSQRTQQLSWLIAPTCRGSWVCTRPPHHPQHIWSPSLPNACCACMPAGAE